MIPLPGACSAEEQAACSRAPRCIHDAATSRRADRSRADCVRRTARRWRRCSSVTPGLSRIGPLRKIWRSPSGFSSTAFPGAQLSIAFCRRAVSGCRSSASDSAPPGAASSPSVPRTRWEMWFHHLSRILRMQPSGSASRNGVKFIRRSAALAVPAPPRAPAVSPRPE